MVFDINANNSVYHCCPGSTPDSQQEHTNTHTRHVKPEEMPNAKVCHVSVPNRTRCSPFNACWLLHKHCALTFIWAFYIKVVELNMKSGTRLCCLSWQSALRQTHAYAQIWIQRRSINELQLQLGGTTIYKKWNRLSSPHTCTQRSCRTIFGGTSHQTHIASHVNSHGTQSKIPEKLFLDKLFMLLYCLSHSQGSNLPRSQKDSFIYS